eukprot:Hpha_TRINITY_DN4506_c0_g1::TRINITY_DN4506_c0_g1_i2::g.115474::m.115474
MPPAQGLLSVIPRSNRPALRVWDRASDRWLPAEDAMEEGEAVVLVGQQLHAITGGRLLPCLHQVLPVPGEERRSSCIFFLRLPQTSELRLLMGPKGVKGSPASAVTRVTDQANEFLARRSAACVVSAMLLSHKLRQLEGFASVSLTVGDGGAPHSLYVWFQDDVPTPEALREAVSAAAEGAMFDGHTTMQWRGMLWALHPLPLSNDPPPGLPLHSPLPLLGRP